MKLAIEESLRTAKLEERGRVPSKGEKAEERIIPRKDKKIEEEEESYGKSKRHKRNKNKEQDRARELEKV